MRSILIVELFLLHFFYIHAKDITKNKEEAFLDKCIVKVKLKNSDVSFSIYASDVENMASYYKITNGYYNKEDILVDILKRKIAMFFGKKPNKEEMKALEKQVDRQIQLQLENILDQCEGDIELFQKQIGNVSIEEYKDKIKKTQIENFLFEQFINDNPSKEVFSIDEIENYYLEKKNKGTLKKIPESYHFWAIKIKAHNQEKAYEVVNFIAENKWDLNVIKDKIKDGIQVGEINDAYDNEKSLFPQNVRETIFKMEENKISNIIKTSNGLFILKKKKDKGVKNYCCEYIFIPDKKKDEYKQDILKFWEPLLKRIKEIGNIENNLSQLSSFIKNNPKDSEKIFKNFEIMITEVTDKKLNDYQKKLFSAMKEGDFTNPSPADNSDNGFYVCYYLAEKVKEHIENLDDDFNSIKNQLKSIHEEKEINNLISSYLKNTEVSYDESVGYTKVLKKYV